MQAMMPSTLGGVSQLRLTRLPSLHIALATSCLLRGQEPLRWRAIRAAVVADNDQDAISKVREMKPGALQCEVWENRRLVISLHRQDLAD
jgi:hypothetical protein